MKHEKRKPGRPGPQEPYKPNFKLMVASLAYVGEKTIEQISNEFNISVPTVCRWKKTLLEKGEVLFNGAEKIISEEPTQPKVEEACSPKIREVENNDMSLQMSIGCIAFALGFLAKWFI